MLVEIKFYLVVLGFELINIFWVMEVVLEVGGYILVDKLVCVKLEDFERVVVIG